MREMVSDGRLPNLSRLMKHGVTCRLHSLEPKQKSPTIWTTIATGKLPEKHGIGDYVDPGTGRLVTSRDRTAMTVWEILGREDITENVVGWLMSWPAEPVNGNMVTNYFRYGEKPGRELPEHLTYPNELLQEVTPLRMTADAISDDEVERFATPDSALSAAEVRGLPVREALIEMNSISAIEPELDGLKSILAADSTFVAVAEYLMDEHPADATFVYLRGLDTASHKFWAAAGRGEVGFPVSRSDEAVFGETVERYYEHADEMLGELLEEFGDDGTVIVCSDHGFEGPKPGRKPGGERDHGPYGILVMEGEDVREGVTLEERSVRDVTPTILELYGLPVAEDMDGEPILEALTSEFLSAHPVESIDTYEAETDGRAPVKFVPETE